MPFYVSRGNIPPKRHIQHRDAQGNLYHEEHASREGFSSIYSNLYHLRPPTRISEVGEFKTIKYSALENQKHRHRHLETFKFEPKGNWVTGRRLLAFNNDVALMSVRPEKEGEFFYRNGVGDEVIFVHHGKGVLRSVFGKLPYGPGDYIVIPRGIQYRLETDGQDNRFFIIESAGIIEPPRRYRNEYGQLLEHAPFCERDFRVPDFEEAVDETGKFPFWLKLAHGIQEYTLAQNPFDVVGWDGFYYPWIFNIKDFMSIVGRIHQPPPVHQTFQAPGFVVCSFCPRLYDFHEKSIPAPYNHSNIDSDEVLYYVEGDFMSRKGVSEGSITIHPYGIAHGPQPGRYEGSIGKKATDEYAVMVDTFRPLTIAREANDIDDPHYPYSWIDDK
ncbi:MAG: homogentisate 1,2-dioxygenase [Calditrichia bacterium]